MQFFKCALRGFICIWYQEIAAPYCPSLCLCVFVSNMQDRRELAKTPTMSRRGRSSLWSMLCMPWHTLFTTWTRTSVPTTRGSALRWSTREAKSCSSTSAVLTSTVSRDHCFSSMLSRVTFFRLISLYLFFIQCRSRLFHCYASLWKKTMFFHVLAKANRLLLPKDRNCCWYFRIPSRRLISYGRSNWVKA